MDPPGDHPEDLRELRCYFSRLAAERSLLSISLEAAVGHVSVGWVPLDQGGPVQDVVRFPIQGPDREYTLDFTFDRQGMAPPEFVMTLEPGIEWMLFNSATLQTAPLTAAAAGVSRRRPPGPARWPRRAGTRPAAPRA